MPVRGRRVCLLKLGSILNWFKLVQTEFRVISVNAQQGKSHFVSVLIYISSDFETILKRET